MIWILDVFASLFSWPKGLFKYKATLNIVLVHINTFGIAIGILCVPSSIIAVLSTYTSTKVKMYLG